MALDDLARGARRSGPPESASGIGRLWARLANGAPAGSPRRRGVIAIVVVALVAVAVPGWRLVRRPLAAEDTLPRVSTTARPSPTPNGAGPGADPGPGPGADPAGTAPPAASEPRTPAELVVHVVGAVGRPGIVRLAAGARVVDAVDTAGGLAPGADVDRVNLAATLVDGQRIVIPLVGQTPPVEVAPGTVSAAGPAPTGTGPASPSAPVDLNTASAEQLDTLPGVGPATAAAIIAHRTESGPFASVDELLDVRGIGEARLESLRDLVTVGP